MDYQVALFHHYRWDGGGVGSDNHARTLDGEGGLSRLSSRPMPIGQYDAINRSQSDNPWKDSMARL